MRNHFALVAALLLLFGAHSTYAKEVAPMLGSVIIDGYDFGADQAPSGSFAFDKETGEFVGTYRGLKMPAGRRALFAWVHDTVNQKSEYIGAVGWLQKSGGKTKGKFRFPVPDKFKQGDFGSYEILAFTAEETNWVDDTGKALKNPTEPSGSAIQKAHKPAFYLYGALPGATTQLHYCGHGQDFFYAAAPDKQVCYD